jgi:hypothetical protein
MPAYDNTTPLFIGGSLHGQHRPVPLDVSAVRNVTEATSLAELEDSPTTKDLDIYRAAHLRISGERFRLFIHDNLDTLNPAAIFNHLLQSINGNAHPPEFFAQLLGVLETAKLFVQAHPHDAAFMARLIQTLGTLAPDRYPPDLVAKYTTGQN